MLDLLKSALAALAVMFVAITGAPGPALAESVEKAPDHCIYLYAAASSRMANAVVGIVTKIDALDEIGYTNEAVQLAKNLGCPMEPMIAAIECTVAEAIKQNASRVTPIQVIDCVEFHAGQPLPAFSEN